MKRLLDKLKENRVLVIVIVMVIVGTALYANTFRNQMFWDDNDFILNNQYVQNFDVIHMFNQNVIAGAGLLSNYWRPVLLVVFSIEHHLWGSHPFGYHLINLLFHIANAILLFYLFRNLFKKDWLAFLTSLLFLIHPLQTEAVSYVNSLGDSLSVFFILLGLNNYLYFRTHSSALGARRSFWWSVAFFPLALMSKETAIVYPALILLVELFLRPFRNPEFISGSHRRDPETSSGLLGFMRNLWPTMGIAAFYILLRATTLNFQNTFNLYNEQNVFTAHIWIRILIFFKSLSVYFGLLFYPHNLHMERSLEIAQSFLDTQVILGFLFFASLIALAIWQYKKHPAVSFGCAWLLIGLAPVSNIAVPINGLLYEHWLYLPMVGFWLMFFSLFPSPFTGEGGAKRRMRVVIITGLLIYFIFLSYQTIARNIQWHDPIRFYNQTLEYAPNSYRVINNLGMAYADSNEQGKAIEMYERAIGINPEVQVAYHNLGNSYKSLGQLDRAIEYFEMAITKDPRFFYSYNALAQIYLDRNQPDKLQELEQRYKQAMGR